MNRREQLFLLWATAIVIVVIALLGTLVVFASPRPPKRISVGRIDQYPPGSFTEVSLPPDFADPLAMAKTPPKAWVVRDQTGTFTAFYARSTEHGYPIRWLPESRRFADGVLGSYWDDAGTYLSGADPRDLDRFPTSIENGELLIELTLIRGASHHE